MLRNPALKPVPSDPNAPTIPDIDLTLGHAQCRSLHPRAAGDRPAPHRPHRRRRALIADKRAQLTADADAIVAPGVRGGDTLHLRIDAVPSQDRLLSTSSSRHPPAASSTAMPSSAGAVAVDRRAGRLGGIGTAAPRRRSAASRSLNSALTARDGSFRAAWAASMPGIHAHRPGRTADRAGDPCRRHHDARQAQGRHARSRCRLRRSPRRRRACSISRNSQLRQFQLRRGC